MRSTISADQKIILTRWMIENAADLTGQTRLEVATRCEQENGFLPTCDMVKAVAKPLEIELSVRARYAPDEVTQLRKDLEHFHGELHQLKRELEEVRALATRAPTAGARLALLANGEGAGDVG